MEEKMDLYEELLKEHSKYNSLRLANYVDQSKEKFHTLFEFAYGTDNIISQRAAWVLGICVERHPFLINPYLKQVILKLPYDHFHQAVLRNTLRMLRYASLPAKFEGILIEKCFEIITENKHPTAIKAFAIDLLFPKIKMHPELVKELKLILTSQISNASRGIISKMNRIINHQPKD